MIFKSSHLTDFQEFSSTLIFRRRRHSSTVNGRVRSCRIRLVHFVNLSCAEIFQCMEQRHFMGRDFSSHGAEMFTNISRFKGTRFTSREFFKSWSRDFQFMNISHFKGTHFVCRDFSSHGAETFRCFQLHGAKKRFESCAGIFQELSSGAST